MQIKAPRGTYDILPEEAVKWQWMEQIIERNRRTVWLPGNSHSCV